MIGCVFRFVWLPKKIFVMNSLGLATYLVEVFVGIIVIQNYFLSQDCGLLTNPVNGIVTLPDKTTEGKSAIYSCDVGYALSDVSLKIRACLSTGAWSLTAPLCVIGKCVHVKLVSPWKEYIIVA